MSRGLKEVHRSDVAAEIEKHLSGRFRQVLNSRGPGHCMRVADLDDELMKRLCSRLRGELPGALIYVLGDQSLAESDDLYLSSTKLIELRNPDADGNVRPPLVVFVPNELRTSSEDSFGIATFEEIRIGDVYTELNAKLLEEIPTSVRTSVQGVLQRVAQGDWELSLIHI